ncbi:hypothetical protein CDD83_9347 [Cordyceps sp. RAO-2017]|nr:hypothetical protein CDD83_9347 [Cordyceps sp. RAO-2017]
MRPRNPSSKPQPKGLSGSRQPKGKESLSRIYRVPRPHPPNLKPARVAGSMERVPQRLKPKSSALDFGSASRRAGLASKHESIKRTANGTDRRLDGPGVTVFRIFEEREHGPADDRARREGGKEEVSSREVAS